MRNLSINLAIFLLSLGKLGAEESANSICPQGKKFHEQIGECILDIPKCSPTEYLDQLSLSCVPKPPTSQDCQLKGLAFDLQSRKCVPFSFKDHCEDSEQSYEYLRTVSCILNKIQAYHCREAEEYLQQKRKLSLTDHRFKVGSLEPFADLPFLEELRLENQSITDVTPLAKVKNLRKLSLANNEISDLTPLESLKQLNYLDITRNPIEDLSFLKAMPQLKTLVIEENKLNLLPKNVKRLELRLAKKKEIFP